MTIATYSELVSEMGDWLVRTDLTAKIPTFVRLFEARMNRRLRSPDMEQTFTFTTVSGTTLYALSARIRELRNVRLDTSATQSSSSVRYRLVSESIEFSSDPGTGLIITYTGYTTLLGLGTGNPTNWLLDDHPDAYLFGSLCMAETYLRDDERLKVWKSAWDEALAEIIREANQKRLPAGQLVSRPQRGDNSSFGNFTGSFSNLEDDPGDLAGLLG